MCFIQFNKLNHDSLVLVLSICLTLHFVGCNESVALLDDGVLVVSDQHSHTSILQQLHGHAAFPRLQVLLGSPLFFLEFVVGLEEKGGRKEGRKE